MANYDDSTKKFIEDITKDLPKDVNKRSVGQTIRRTGEQVKKKPIATAKSIAKEIGLPEGSSPMAKAKTVASIATSLATKKNIPAMTAKQITREILEKEAAAVDESIKRKPITVYNQMTKDFDKQWHDWEPETIREVVKDKPELNDEDAIATIFALQAILRTDFPAESWNVFENVGHALNENNVMVNYVTPLEPHECALTIETIRDIRPKLEISEEVCAYCAACGMEAGLVLLPPKYFPRLAQKKLDELNRDPAIKDMVLAALETNERGSDDVVDTQIAKIMDIRSYVETNMGRS